MQPTKPQQQPTRGDGQTPFLNEASAAQFRTMSDKERLVYAYYAEHYGEYAPIMSKLYPLWRQLNARCRQARAFDDKKRCLQLPHLTIGFCPPRALGYCRRIADHGGFMQITMRHNLFDGSYSGVNNTWKGSLGVKRLVDDILLHEMVHQYHFEITATPELKQGGHGKAFRDTCNRISEELFVPEDQWSDDGSVHQLSRDGRFGPRIAENWKVYVRKRGPKSADKRVANHWPINIRPKNYYGEDVASCCWVKPPKPRHVPTWCMIFENLVAYYEAGQIDHFVQEAKAELKKFQDADCADCVSHWASLWDEPVCTLEALKPRGLPSHWLDDLPKLLDPKNADSNDPLI